MGAVKGVTTARGAFSVEEHEHRVGKVRALMTSDQHDLDALLVTSPENIYYLIGLTHQGYFAFTMLVLPREGDPALLTRRMEAYTISQQAPDINHVGYAGLHVTAVGADAETKQEIHHEAVAAADRFVCDSLSQSRRLGELRAVEARGLDMPDAVELGDVISGNTPGRVRDDDVTICDLTGTGGQDTAIASLAVERCTRMGAGLTIET